MLHDLNRMRSTCVLASILLGLTGLSPAAAQTRPVPDTFEAVTADMTPTGTTIKIDIVHWSDESERAAAIAALGAEPDVASKLRELPTAGYVWLEGSGVGYAVKYAHRQSDDGAETVTIVTDRVLGAYSYKPWSAAAAGDPLDYSVIALQLDSAGHGRGTLSLVADVEIDAQSQTIHLEPRATVLTDAVRQPKPYWARDAAANGG